MKLIFATSRLFLASLIAIVLCGAMPWNVSAAPKPPQDGAKVALQRAFAEQQHALTALGRKLDRADARAAKVASWIAKVKAQGKDTTALDAALSAFKDKIAAARASWAAADATLKAHAGFDDSGKVTDSTAARATVEQARSQLESTRRTLAGAYRDLRAAVVAYRKAHRGVDDPQVPAEE